MKYLVAYERHHAQFAAKEILQLKPTQWIFVGDAYALRGLDKPEVIFIDAPRYKPFRNEMENRLEIERMAKNRNATISRVELP
jgi:hypothetical protein